MKNDDLTEEIRHRMKTLGESADQATQFILEREQQIRSAIETHMGKKERPKQPKASVDRFAIASQKDKDLSAARARNVAREFEAHQASEARQKKNGEKRIPMRVFMGVAGAVFSVAGGLGILGSIIGIYMRANSQTQPPDNFSPEAVGRLGAFAIFLGLIGYGSWLIWRAVYPRTASSG